MTRESHNRNQKRHRDKKIASGICEVCTKLLSPRSKRYCQYHAEQHAAYSLKSYRKRKQEKKEISDD